YPENLMKQGLKGTVSVDVALDSAGLVADAHVLSGPQEFRKAALQSVLDWHFTREAANSNRQVTIGFEPPPADWARGDFYRLEADRIKIDGHVTIEAPPGGQVAYLGWHGDAAEKNREAVQALTIETGQQGLHDKVIELRTTLEKNDLAGQQALLLERAD